MPAPGDTLRNVPWSSSPLGYAELVKEWSAPSGTFDRQWLVLGNDGEMLLVSSRHTTGQHAVASMRFTPFNSKAAVTVDHFSTYDKELAAEPTVDGRGMTLLVMLQSRMGVIRRTALSGSAASLDALSTVL